jgi:hypothetical protein
MPSTIALQSFHRHRILYEGRRGHAQCGPDQVPFCIGLSAANKALSASASLI